MFKIDATVVMCWQPIFIIFQKKSAAINLTYMLVSITSKEIEASHLHVVSGVGRPIRTPPYVNSDPLTFYTIKCPDYVSVQKDAI
jgi:hypothetical protein